MSKVINRIFKSTRHVIYLAAHVVCFCVGLVFCQAAVTSVWFSVGGSLVATGIAGCVIFAYVLLSDDLSERMRTLSEFGLVSIFDARSVRIRHEYESRLLKAQERIDIIGFGLSAFREDFAEDFRKWKSRANVRILVLDPEFPAKKYGYADQRDKEEKNLIGKISDDVEKFLNDLSPLIGESDGRIFEIRLYRCLPTLNIFRIDDDLFWGPYLIGEQSRNSPTFLVRRGGVLFERFSKQFERIWEEFAVKHEASK